jgi:hypothetical protein
MKLTVHTFLTIDGPAPFEAGRVPDPDGGSEAG